MTARHTSRFGELYHDQYMVPNTTHWIQCANKSKHVPIFPGDTRVTLVFVPALMEEIPKRVLLQRASGRKGRHSRIHFCLSRFLPQLDASGSRASPRRRRRKRSTIKTPSRISPKTLASCRRNRASISRRCSMPGNAGARRTTASLSRKRYSLASCSTSSRRSFRASALGRNSNALAITGSH